MTPKEVRDLALRAVDDHDSWAVLEDHMLEDESALVIVAKVIFRAWGRRWPMVERLRPRASLEAMSRILRDRYRQGPLREALYRDSPLFQALPRSPDFLREEPADAYETRTVAYYQLTAERPFSNVRVMVDHPAPVDPNAPEEKL